MRKYRLVAKKGEGTFSEVLKAQNVKDGKYHAIKCMKNHFDNIDQVNNLREIQALRRLSPHQHIISLEEVLYDQPTGRLALVFELMDANLYELIRGRRHYLNPNLVKSYMFQLVRALHHMHRKGIFHRDIKPENILIENTSEIGRGLKLADFGSCRGIYSKQPYTEYISTRWYRAPECLLTDGYYGAEMDLWGAGCVFFEITSLYPLFPGTNELDQINRIHKVLGTPSAEVLAKFKQNGAAHVNFDFPEQKGIGINQMIPHAPEDGVGLMTGLLAYDAQERTSAREALQHNYFKDVRDLEARRQQQGDAAATITMSGRLGGGKTHRGGGGGGVEAGDAHAQPVGMAGGGADKRGDPHGAGGGGGAGGKALPNIGGQGLGKQKGKHGKPNILSKGGHGGGAGGGQGHGHHQYAQKHRAGGGASHAGGGGHAGGYHTGMSSHGGQGPKGYGVPSSMQSGMQPGAGAGDESLPPISGVTGNATKLQSNYGVGGTGLGQKSKKKKKSGRGAYGADTRGSVGSFAGTSGSTYGYSKGYGRQGGSNYGGKSIHKSGRRARY